jgi:hypothetical protein
MGVSGVISVADQPVDVGIDAGVGVMVSGVISVADQPVDVGVFVGTAEGDVSGMVLSIIPMMRQMNRSKIREPQPRTIGE